MSHGPASWNPLVMSADRETSPAPHPCSPAAVVLSVPLRRPPYLRLPLRFSRRNLSPGRACGPGGTDRTRPALGCGGLRLPGSVLRASEADVRFGGCDYGVGPGSGTKWSVRGGKGMTCRSRGRTAWPFCGRTGAASPRREGSFSSPSMPGKPGSPLPATNTTRFVLSERATQTRFSSPTVQRKPGSSLRARNADFVPLSERTTQTSFLSPSMNAQLSSPLSSRSAFGPGNRRHRTGVCGGCCGDLATVD